MYAQKDYPQIQGNNGVNTIAEIGSLLTAFSNLLTRFDYQVDPATLNTTFIEDGVYLEKQDVVRDRLAFSSISAYDPTIGIGSYGKTLPESNDAIIAIDYVSKLTGEIATTYCLVADAQEQTIVDSYDGKVKPWAVYGQPVTVVEYMQYEALANNNPLKAKTPTVPEEPEQPVDESPDTYTIHNQMKAYASSDDATAQVNASITVHAGNYYVYEMKDGLVNITATIGQPGAWVNVAENVDGTEIEHAIVEMDDEPTPVEADESFDVPVRVVPIDPDKWKTTYKPGLGVVEYVARNNCTVHDLAGVQPDKELNADTIVPIAGHFIKDDITYLRTKLSVDADNWYGVPKTNLIRKDTVEEELDRILSADEDDFKAEFGDPDARDFLIKMGAQVEGRAKQLKQRFSMRKK